MEVEGPIQVLFQTILDRRDIWKHEPHSKDLYFKELISSYSCFSEKNDTRGNPKWASNKKHHYVSDPNRKSERPKIGVKDLSKEGLIRKDFQSILNKLTATNMDSMVRQTRTLYTSEFMSVYVDILWEYFKRQPEFQGLYLQILESIYLILVDDDILEMNLLWSKLWNNYIQENKWVLNYELVEQSHNYDDFCDYVKEKKKVISIAQAWSRLIGIGCIRAEPFEWLLQMCKYCYDLDLSNKVYKTTIECYVEQIKEFYKYLPKHIVDKTPSQFVHMIYDMKEIPSLPKSCYFKLLDFIEVLEKNENTKKILSYHQLEHHDGL